jgi:Amt family ammonium transporter
LCAGAFSFIAVQLRLKWRLDDALDVWAIYGISGTWGGIAVGIFTTATLMVSRDCGTVILDIWEYN